MSGNQSNPDDTTSSVRIGGRPLSDVRNTQLLQIFSFLQKKTLIKSTYFRAGRDMDSQNC